MNLGTFPVQRFSRRREQGGEESMCVCVLERESDRARQRQRQKESPETETEILNFLKNKIDK